MRTLLALSLLLGCASSHGEWFHKDGSRIQWFHVAKDQQRYDVDRGACITAVTSMTKHPQMRAQLFWACMGAKGWRLLEVIW